MFCSKGRTIGEMRLQSGRFAARYLFEARSVFYGRSYDCSRTYNVHSNYSQSAWWKGVEWKYKSKRGIVVIGEFKSPFRAYFDRYHCHTLSENLCRDDSSVVTKTIVSICLKAGRLVVINNILPISLFVKHMCTLVIAHREPFELLSSTPLRSLQSTSAFYFHQPAVWLLVCVRFSSLWLVL